MAEPARAATKLPIVMAVTTNDTNNSLSTTADSLGTTGLRFKPSSAKTASIGSWFISGQFLSLNLTDA